MKLNRIEWQNIGPYGNKVQVLDLSPEGALWVLIGKNGAGKSTILNLSKAAYYGKVDKVKKDEIANRFNKHGLIRAHGVLNDGSECVIERTFSPSSLFVSKNAEDIGKSGISDYQTYIEDEAVGLPYTIFSNIITLSVDDFKSFLTMTPNDKRTIIDKIFSMEIINKIYELLKKDIKDYKYKIDLFNKEIQTFNYNINRTSSELDKLKQKLNEDNAAQINKLLAKAEEFKPKLVEATAKFEEFSTKKNELEAIIKKYEIDNIKRKESINIFNNKLKLYSQDKCPTCEHPFNTNEYDSIKEDLVNKINNLKTEYENLNETIKSYINSFNSVNDGINKLNTYIYQIKSNLNNINSHVISLSDINKDGLDSLQNIISDNIEKLHKLEKNKVTIDIDIKYLQVLETLYSNDGIKKKILENYLPTLNEELSYVLDQLHFPYHLEFTSDFDPIIKHLGLEISTGTLSTGEKKRADLAVLISIIRMIKRKYPNINLFMLDEILSSVDSEGIYDFLNVLQKTSKEMFLNIFIVNHSPLPIEYFDFKVNIDKVDGFSDITVEKF